MKYIATINTPGYLPDNEPEEYDDVESAWAGLLHSRQTFEEEASGYERRANYTDGVLVLARLAGRDTVNSETQPTIFPHQASDGQVTGYYLSPVGTGWVQIATSLSHHEPDDHSLPEVFSVSPAEEIR
jgi:hypothetical protein